MLEGKIVTVTVNGIAKKCEYGARLSDAIDMELMCGGHGKCGKCKVVARGELSEISPTERERLTAVEIAQGIRLACMTRVLGDCEVSTSLPSSSSHRIVSEANMPQIDLDPSFKRLGMALDIGTTTLAARLYDTEGKLLSDAVALNPQSLFGADVISRIEASLAKNADKLAQLIRDAISSLALELCKNAGRESREIDALVLTGNTAMLYLLTESSPLALSRAPFAADKLFGEEIDALALGIDILADGAKIYLPPCISAFVGADTVCALLSSELCDSSESGLLVDIGTNGEMALWKDGNLSVCSTAAGPAFEGVGISSGMRGESGAIDKVAILNGKLCPHVIGEAQARGICGSGIVDAAACMLELELMDETGFIEDETVELAEGVELTQQDIRALQLAKSAIYAGICTLAAKSNCELTGISRLIVAGGFGNYLNMISAARIGLLPSEMLGKISVVGNAALAGASMLLLDKKLLKKASAIAQSATVAELASDPIFSELYMNSMLF
jgi:uncharacterized 2Fe-2S/4Fe-4S cluster protein (DUF4445 family)